MGARVAATDLIPRQYAEGVVAVGRENHLDGAIVGGEIFGSDIDPSVGLEGRVELDGVGEDGRVVLSPRLPLDLSLVVVVRLRAPHDDVGWWIGWSWGDMDVCIINL